MKRDRRRPRITCKERDQRRKRGIREGRERTKGKGGLLRESLYKQEGLRNEYSDFGDKRLNI